jgi:hypothetical protein
VLANGSEFSCAAQMPRYLTLVRNDGARKQLTPDAPRRLQ